MVAQPEADPAMVRDRGFARGRAVTHRRAAERRAQLARNAEPVEKFVQRHQVVLVEHQLLRQVAVAQVEHRSMLHHRLFAFVIAVNRVALFRKFRGEVIGERIDAAAGQLQPAAGFAEKDPAAERRFFDHVVNSEHLQHLREHILKTAGEVEPRVERHAAAPETLHEAADLRARLKQRHAPPRRRQQQRHAHAADAAADHDRMYSGMPHPFSLLFR